MLPLSQPLMQSRGRLDVGAACPGEPEVAGPRPCALAAGVEPVVRAERIVSTDKKALAAGDILKEAATTVFLPSVAASFICYSITHTPYMRAFCSLMVSS